VIILYNSLYRTQFVRAIAEIACQSDRIEPELRAPIFTIHVNVRGFMGLVAVEVKSIRPNPQYRRHEAILPDGALGATIFWTEPPGERPQPGRHAGSRSSVQSPIKEALEDPARMLLDI
jgi:hypothetical protein